MIQLLKIYYRNLKHNKLNYLITILGFSFSFAIVIILMLFIIKEKSYDKNFINVDNIYLVVTTKNKSFVEEDAKEILTNKYPQIESACRYDNYKENLIYNNDFFKGQTVSTDEGFFDIFSIQFIYGSQNTAFSNIQGIVLTESFAKRIFNINYPIGKIIKTESGIEYHVTGIIKDLPKCSSIIADCFIYYKSKTHHSGINDVETTHLFVVLQPHAIIKDFEKKLSSTLIKSSKILNNNHINYGKKIEWKLSPFNNAYFNTELKGTHLLHANKKLIQAISLIALIILILAIINYINISTAAGISRINEIALRKANGAGNKNIFYQFLLESLFTCILSTVLAFLFTYLLTPIFEKIFNKPIDLNGLTTYNIGIILLVIFLTGLISGVVPALIASKYSPIQIFSKSRNIFKSYSYRNALNTFQFTVSMAIIICLLLILKQLNFSKNRNPGFNANYLINVDYPGNISKSGIILNALFKNTSILNVSFSNGSPMGIFSHVGSGKPIENISIMSADDKFIETFKLKLIQGRNIHYPSKIKECLITGNAYKESGWDNLDNKVFQKNKVVGVINIFCNDDLHHSASNIMISNSLDDFSSANIRISPQNISESLNYIKSIWKEHFPDNSFRYTFYDEWIENSFLNEKNDARIAFLFGLLSFILSLLGLIGLTNYTIKQKIKEIGIRKINGAKVFEIINLLNNEFLKWIIIAFIIACPLSMFIINKWLNSFAYKTAISWWIFALAGSITILISLLTSSLLCWKTANKNPVEALRHE